MKRAGGQAARRVARLCHGALGFGFGVLLMAGIVAGAVAWRMSRGPVSSAFAARELSRVLSAPGRTVRIGDAGLAWGPGRAVRVTVRDVSVSGDGPPAARVAEASVAVPVGALLLGHLRPSAVVLREPELRLERAEDGSVQLAGLPRSAGTGTGAGPAVGDARLSALRSVRIEDARVTVAGVPGGDVWLDGASVDFSRARGGFSGGGEAALHRGEATARIAATAAPDGTDTRLAVTAEPVTPSALGIEGADAMGAPVGGTVSARFGPDFGLRGGSAHLTAGAGPVVINGQAMPLVSAALDVEATRDAIRLTAARITEGMPGHKPTTIVVSGTGARQGGKLSFKVDATLDQAQIADLPALWPPKIGGPGTRPWITENVVAGLARDAAFHIEFWAPEDVSDATMTVATGTLAADDVTFYWLRPVPPVEHSAVRLRMSDPDTIVVSLSGGETLPDGAKGRLALRDGTVKLTGLAGKHQFATIDGVIAGAVGDAFALLHEKRLHLFDRTNFDLKDPSGSAMVNLHVFLPLEDKVTMDDVPIHAKATLDQVRLPGILGGRDVSEGAATLDVTQEGLKLAGTANLAGVVSDLTAAFDFRSGPPSQVQYRGAVSGRLEPRALAAAGIDTGGRFGGSALLSGEASVRRDGGGEASVRADLTAAALSASPLDFTKPAGAPGAFMADLTLNHGKVLAAHKITLTGPELEFTGSATRIADGLRLDYTRIRLGGTDAAGTLTVPDDAARPIRADLHGQTLDLASRFKPGGAPGAPASPVAKPAARAAPAARNAAGRPYAVSASFARVAVAEGQSMADVSARAESDGTILNRLMVRGAVVTAGRQKFSADIVPGANRTRTFSADTADAGGFLRGLGVADRLTGGAMRIAGVFDDTTAAHALRGNAEMTGFTLKGAPALAKIVQALSIYGVADALRGPGLYFARLSAPFTYDAQMLTLTNARAYSASLGITVGGSLDLMSRRAEMRGTIVPSYALNRLPGRIPIIGKYLSPEDNSGLFAAKFSVSGPLADPDVSVNTLSALTPGALRDLFGGK